MNNPLVTAIITTHNRLGLLKKAINSVLKQTYKNIELIVVNDNSTNETSEYLEKICRKYSNVKHIFIPKEETKGGNYARNMGILNSHGEYIGFLDDDDEWMSTKIEKQVEFLNHNQEYGMVYCARRVEKDFKDVEDVFQDKEFRGDLSQKCFRRIFCLTSMILVKSDVIKESGLFDERLKSWQEYDLCIRISQITKIGCVDEPLILYRIIQKDRNRNTNNLSGWKESVEIINKKYSDKISKLDKETKEMWVLNMLYDGAYRAENSGLRREKRHYLLEIYKVTRKTKHFVRFILNTNLSAKMYFERIFKYKKRK